MKTNTDKLSQHLGRLTLLLITALLVAACGGNEPTPTPAAAPAATTAPAAATPEEPAGAPESPLDQPESPLLQPESPLTTAPASPPQTEEDAIALAAETAAPEPAEGFGSLSAVLWSHGIKQAIFGTQFYLTPADEVDGEFVPPEIYFGPQPENGDVGSKTNLIGQVQLDNIPPGHYYMLVWTVYNWLSVFQSPDSTEPLLITIEEGDQLELGVLYSNWP
ncbi:MAG: hypothetical protein IT328_20865 [Caldilineaceae bacterium]|nr:hypothetical protein [Caldilineaceae bacterium]